MMSRSTRPFRRTLAIAMIPALLFLGSCSSPSPLCEDAQNLKDAVQGLTEVDVESGGIDALTSAVEDVRSTIDALGSEAQNTFGTEIAAVQKQLTALGGEVDKVQGGKSVSSVAPAVVASISELKTALSDLETAAQAQDCDLS